MYLNANSKITIGKIQFLAVNEVIIETSVKDLEAKATITMPRNVVAKEGKGVTDFIKRGDAVTIELGYNGNFYTEFTGFVDEIGSDTPLVIECDNYWYNHKKNTLNKSWERASLKEVLAFALPDYKVDCPDVQLGKFLIKSASTFEVVKGLMRSVGFFTKLDEANKIVSCYWSYEPTKYETHTYVFGSRNEAELRKLNLFPNVRKSNLTFKIKDDIKLRITAKAITKAGKHLKVKIGSYDKDAEKRTRNFGHEIENEKQLREAAERDLKRWSYAGYKGSISGFGFPLTRAGDTLKLIDIDNPEREGQYLIERVKITYSAERANYIRENTLSYKL